jgi:hypothetical protein
MAYLGGSCADYAGTYGYDYRYPFRTAPNPPGSQYLTFSESPLTISFDMALCIHVHMYSWLSAKPIPFPAQKGMFMADKKANIHIVVDESVLIAAKICCIQEGLVLSDVITQLLREWAADKAKTKRG